MPPISWTSKSRTPIVRLNASRTAAYASKIRSSSDSPFSRRCLNSAVFPRSSSSVSFSKSGSSVPMYAACSASRLTRRPFAHAQDALELPEGLVDTGLGYRLAACQRSRHSATTHRPRACLDQSGPLPRRSDAFRLARPGIRASGSRSCPRLRPRRRTPPRDVRRAIPELRHDGRRDARCRAIGIARATPELRDYATPRSQRPLERRGTQSGSRGVARAPRLGSSSVELRSART